MASRILRDASGYPRRGPTQVIRKKPHTCGRNCPFHDEGVQAVMRQARNAGKPRRDG